MFVQRCHAVRAEKRVAASIVILAVHPDCVQSGTNLTPLGLSQPIGSSNAFSFDHIDESHGVFQSKGGSPVISS